MSASRRRSISIRSDAVCKIGCRLSHLNIFLRQAIDCRRLAANGVDSFAAISKGRAAALNTHEGKIVNPAVAASLPDLRVEVADEAALYVDPEEEDSIVEAVVVTSTA